MAGLITAKTLTGTIVGTPTKPYDGGTTATLTSANFSVPTGVSGETITVTNATAAYNFKDVATATTVTSTLASGTDFSISGTGALLSNYTLPTTAAGAGAITPVTITATITSNPTKVYDGNATAAGLTAASYTVVGAVSSDVITVTKTTATYNSKDVVTATTVTATLANPGDFAIAGANAPLLTNYTLPPSAGGPGTITPVTTLVVSLVGTLTKPYDGGTAATLDLGELQRRERCDRRGHHGDSSRGDVCQQERGGCKYGNRNSRFW